MNLYFEHTDFFGSLKLFTDIEKGIFLVKPRGIVNPSLVKLDLKYANNFSLEVNKEWIYIVDTEDVLFPNPLNLFYLSRIKTLPNRSKYYIFAPSFIVRLLGRLTEFIIKPDKVISSRSEFESLLRQ